MRENPDANRVLMSKRFLSAILTSFTRSEWQVPKVARDLRLDRGGVPHATSDE